MKETIGILKENHLKITDCRVQMLELFMQERKMITHSEIEKSLSVKHDRVTVYRTLNSFIDKNIIHKIASTDPVGKYALCTVEDHCNDCHQHNEHVHNNEHIHFVCDVCKATTCIDSDISKLISLPKGYALNHKNITFSGICDKCGKE